MQVSASALTAAELGLSGGQATLTRMSEDGPLLMCSGAQGGRVNTAMAVCSPSPACTPSLPYCSSYNMSVGGCDGGLRGSSLASSLAGMRSITGLGLHAARSMPPCEGALVGSLDELWNDVGDNNGGGCGPNGLASVSSIGRPPSLCRQSGGSVVCDVQYSNNGMPARPPSMTLINSSSAGAGMLTSRFTSCSTIAGSAGDMAALACTPRAEAPAVCAGGVAISNSVSSLSTEGLHGAHSTPSMVQGFVDIAALVQGGSDDVLSDVVVNPCRTPDAACSVEESMAAEDAVRTALAMCAPGALTPAGAAAVAAACTPQQQQQRQQQQNGLHPDGGGMSQPLQQVVFNCQQQPQQQQQFLQQHKARRRSSLEASAPPQQRGVTLSLKIAGIQ